MKSEAPSFRLDLTQLAKSSEKNENEVTSPKKTPSTPLSQERHHAIMQCISPRSPASPTSASPRSVKHEPPLSSSDNAIVPSKIAQVTQPVLTPQPKLKRQPTMYNQCALKNSKAAPHEITQIAQPELTPRPSPESRPPNNQQPRLQRQPALYNQRLSQANSSPKSLKHDESLLASSENAIVPPRVAQFPEELAPEANAPVRKSKSISHQNPSDLASEIRHAVERDNPHKISFNYLFDLAFGESLVPKEGFPADKDSNWMWQTLLAPYLTYTNQAASVSKNCPADLSTKISRLSEIYRLFSTGSLWKAPNHKTIRDITPYNLLRGLFTFETIKIGNTVIENPFLYRHGLFDTTIPYTLNDIHPEVLSFFKTLFAALQANGFSFHGSLLDNISAILAQKKMTKDNRDIYRSIQLLATSTSLLLNTFVRLEKIPGIFNAPYKTTPETLELPTIERPAQSKYSPSAEIKIVNKQIRVIQKQRFQTLLEGTFTPIAFFDLEWDSALPEGKRCEAVIKISSFRWAPEVTPKQKIQFIEALLQKPSPAS